MTFKQVILFQAPIYTRSGYGERARDLAYAILQSCSESYELLIIPTNWGNTPWTGLDTTTERGKLIQKHIVKQPPPQQPDIYIQLTIPNEFQPIGKYNIGITAGIETDLAAPDWIEGCNRMDMLITSSQHALTSLQESKYDVHQTGTNQLVNTLQLRADLKTEVLFEGVDLNTYGPKAPLSRESEVYQTLNSFPESFCFLFVGHWLSGDLGEDRKDVGMLIKTFVEAFERKPASTRPALILKTNGGGYSQTDLSTTTKKIQDVLRSYNSPPTVYLLHADLTDEEMNALYNHPKVKAMVSYTHGEGFGRPLLEFSTTGKPVITSNWSGHLDFLKPTQSVLLPGELVPVHPSAANNWLLKEAKWYRVNYDYAKQVLHAVHDRYKDFSKMCSPQKEYVLSNFTLDKMAEKLKSIIDSIPTAVPFLLPETPSGEWMNIPMPKIKRLTDVEDLSETV